MKKIILTLILVPVIFCSCKKDYEYWDVAKFNLKKDALKDNEEIKLLYASNGPDLNEDKDYYYHLIVVSQKTGDTVNILTTVQNAINKKSGDEIFNFFNEDNIASIVTQKDFDLNSLNGRNIEDIKAKNQNKISKVARDPEFDNIADNKFPTVFGSIGKIN